MVYEHFNSETTVKIPKIAILIPCYNEHTTIATVVKNFRYILPSAKIYVYDNCSTDNTYIEAKNAGAIVKTAKKRGKGNVVRKMFADIDADLYLIVDGDNTYDANDAVKMLDIIHYEHVDMVIASRQDKSEKAYPIGHRLGNKIFNKILHILFASEFHDIFSGYRAFSRRFVKTFPITSDGFEIEAELSIHAISLGLPCVEIKSNYYERPPNSISKLNTIYDGFTILFSIFRLLKENRPLLFFGCISFFFFLFSIFLSFPIFQTYIQTGLVPRIPTAILSLGTMLVSLLTLTCGLILNSLTKTRLEIKKLHYLSIGSDIK